MWWFRREERVQRARERLRRYQPERPERIQRLLYFADQLGDEEVARRLLPGQRELLAILRQDGIGGSRRRSGLARRAWNRSSSGACCSSWSGTRFLRPIRIGQRACDTSASLPVVTCNVASSRRPCDTVRRKPGCITQVVRRGVGGAEQNAFTSVTLGGMGRLMAWLKKSKASRDGGPYIVRKRGLW
jgi:hypothetical protein